ncbi:MAG: hypothetical protein RL148_338 [Planctomycetota bacterium]
MRLPCSVAVFVLCCAPLLHGQEDPVWRVPAAGAVTYKRTLQTGSALATDRRSAEQAEPKDRVPEEYLPVLWPPAMVCQGELAVDQRALGDRPADLRDVLRAVACDLGAKRTYKARFPRMVPFGDLHVSGTVGVADGAGVQQFALKVVSKDVEPLPGEDRGSMNKHVKPLVRRTCEGTITLARTYDAGRGIVSRWDATLDLVVTEAPKAHRRIRVVESWQVEQVRENQDAAFRSAVARAIRDGADWIRKDVTKFDRPNMQDKEEEDRSYGSGRIALGLLTLLKAEVPASDPAIVAGFGELARRKLVDTYSLGVALMAMEARYAPPNERDQLLSGQIAAPRTRVLPEADKALAQEWLATLMTNLDTRVDAGYRVRFNYTAGPRFDISVNQYGLLGLWSAHLCGLAVPPGWWRAAAEALLEQQERADGRTVPLVLTDHRQAAAAPDANRTVSSPWKTEPRGWAYREPVEPTYGAMTAAGIGGLALCRAGLLATNQGKADVLPEIDAGMRDGFAWLATEFSVRYAPGFVGRNHRNFYYYMYGLERACELAGVARLQGRDWYFEGAMALLEHQQRNGSFRIEVQNGGLFDATCFAVLFLKKATLPAVSGAPVTGPGEQGGKEPGRPAAGRPKGSRGP